MITIRPKTRNRDELLGRRAALAAEVRVHQSTRSRCARRSWIETASGPMSAARIAS